MLNILQRSPQFSFSHHRTILENGLKRKVFIFSSHKVIQLNFLYHLVLVINITEELIHIVLFSQGRYAQHSVSVPKLF